MRCNSLTLSLLAAAALCGPALAQTASEPLGEAIVTATRLATPVSVTPGTYVIDRVQIDSRQLTFAAQALQTAPGLSVFSNGPFGVTSVRQRGAASDKTLVLLDGVPINDGSQPQGSFDFANLDIDDIARIEVLSGPQASLWGSNAMGGVIALTSRETDGLRASVEGGSFGAAHGNLAAGIANDRWALSGSLSATRSDGISAADEANRYDRFGLPGLRNSEDDGMEERTAAVHGRLALSSAVTLRALYRYMDAHTDIDGYPAAAGFVLADTDDRYASIGRLSQLGATIAAGGFRHEITVSDYNLDRGARGESGDYSYGADRRLARWTVSHGGLEDALSYQAGAEWVDEHATLSTGAKDDLSSGAVFAVARLKPTAPLALTVSGRYDDPRAYKGVATGRLGAAYDVGGGFTLEASFGQGFKTPTISETACDFCFAPPASLKPEHAEGYDGGFSWRSADGRYTARVTAFHLDVRDELTYRDLHYVNLAHTRSKGVEMSGEAALRGGFSLQGTYAYVDAKDAMTGLRELRAPRSSGSATLFWRQGRIDSALTVRAQSRQADTDLDGFSPASRAGFVVADLAGGYALNDTVKLTARIENLADKRYEQAYGFGQPGRAVFVGVKLRH